MIESTQQIPRPRIEAFIQVTRRVLDRNTNNDITNTALPELVPHQQHVIRDTGVIAPQGNYPTLVPINVMLRRQPRQDLNQQARSMGNASRQQGDRMTPMEDLPSPSARDQWQQFFQRHRTNDDQVPDGNRPVVFSVENQRANTHWGDVLMEKPDSVTRVYAMNGNGLSLDRRGGKFSTVCQVQREVQADILCGQEHNLDSDKTQIRSILFNTAQQHWTRSKITFGTSPIGFSSNYKPGGTFMITAGDLTCRVIQQSKDKWGRWVTHTYKGRGALSIAVISAYQVVQKPTMPGSITAASQQQSLLIQAQDVITDPRRAFCRNLQTHIQTCRAEGSEILLVGDFNEVFGMDLEGMVNVALQCNLIDVMRSRHSSADPATYARGRTRLDYSLATGHVVRSLKRAGYEQFNARFHTDHRASFLDFDTARLFGTATQTLGAHAPRILKSNNVTQVTQYIKALYDLLLEHDAFARAERLSHPGNRHAYAERLDRDIVAASLSAEQKMKRFGQPAWSIALVKARKKVTMLSKCLTMARGSYTSVTGRCK